MWPTLLGTLEGPSRRRDPLEGGGPLRGGKAAAVTKLDVKARETQVAVVPPRPSPPPPCQSLTRASSWTACAWQGRHMRAWARARACVGEGSSELGSDLQNRWVAFEHAGDGGCFFGEPSAASSSGSVSESSSYGMASAPRTGSEDDGTFGDHPGNQLAARLVLNGCLPI